MHNDRIRIIVPLLLFLVMVVTAHADIEVSDGVVLTPTDENTTYITHKNDTISSLVVTDVLIDYDGHLVTIKAANITTVRIIDTENYIIKIAGNPQDATINVTNEPYLYSLYRSLFTFQTIPGYWQVFIWNTDDILTLVNKVFSVLFCPASVYDSLLFIGILAFYVGITIIAMVYRMSFVGLVSSLGYLIYTLFIVSCFAVFGWLMVAIAITFILYFGFRRNG